MTITTPGRRRAVKIAFEQAFWTIMAMGGAIGKAQTVTVLPPTPFNSLFAGHPTTEFQFLANGIFLQQGCGDDRSQPFRPNAPCAQSISGAGVQVYTQQGSDAALQTFATQLKPTIDTQISTGISTAQSQIETDLKAKLDSLPTSLLTQAVRDAMQAQILAQLKTRLDDLQSQINSLKAPTPAKPNAAALHKDSLSPSVQSGKQAVTKQKRPPIHNLVRERQA